MKKREISSGAPERTLLLVRLYQDAQLQQRYVAQLPWWRHPLVGYLLSIPLTGLGLLVPMAEQYFTGHTYFLGAPFFLVTVIIALFWGAGPAIFSILLGIIALDYFFLPPPAQINLSTLRDLTPLIPYFAAELVVALITAQRERARRRALFAEQEIQAQVDELEAINRRLEEVNQLKDVFFSRASHELKTPLTVIRGQAQIAQRTLTKLSGNEPQLKILRTSLERIEEQTHRLHGLVDDLLDLGMLSAGKMKLRLKRCDLGDLCRDIIEDQRTLSGRPIELLQPRSPVNVRADCDRLSQVLINLITNAIKYSSEDTPIQVRVQQKQSKAVIEVHNEGTPISQEQQEHIFEPFYRTPDAQSSSKQGWGLGLAISKDIVERHDGKIWVESSPEGGTTFCVELPLN